jgi:PTH2 family peptidyl-tRNA hydrolase
VLVKQVIVVRKDLKMRRGKEIAQGSHASIAFLSFLARKSLLSAKPIELTLAQTEWINGIFKKVCLQVNSEQELLDIHEKALSKGLDVHLIKDSGLTEFNGIATITCLAIGPDEDSKIDEVTGTLSLY